MTGIEQVWNWTESCRFSFPEIGYSKDTLVCHMPDGSYVEPFRKEEYLKFVVAISTEACDQNEVFAKHLGYSALQAGYKCYFAQFRDLSNIFILLIKELKTTSKYEWGCICPAGSCIGDSYDSADYQGRTVIPCMCVDHSSPSFEHTTTRAVRKEDNSYEEQSQLKIQNSCIFPLDRSESLGLGCDCERGRKHYIDPITFQWACKCRDSNDPFYDPSCEDSGTGHQSVLKCSSGLQTRSSSTLFWIRLFVNMHFTKISIRKILISK